jgi:hypothetical protein
VSFALVLRPLALAAPEPALDRAAPVFIAIGRQGGGMQVRVTAAKAAVSGLLRGAFEP